MQLTTSGNSIATALQSATTPVAVNGATAPAIGQVLTATSGTAATWQTPGAGGMVYPGAGVPVSTGTAWASSIANQVVFVPAANVGGTANAITLTPTPAITAYASSVGNVYIFVALSTNTTAATIAISGLGALSLTMGNIALPIGGILSGNMYHAIIESSTSIRVSPFDAASVNGDTFNGKIQMSFSGDQFQLSLDTSPYRTGSNSVLTSGAMYTLLGETAMQYWTHNTALDASGNFLGRDDTGPCTFWVYTESGLVKTYNSPSASSGTVPTFTLLQTFDTNTGNITIGAQAAGNGLLNIPSSTVVPATPAANTVSIFGRQIAGRNYPAAIGPSGLDFALQPIMARNKIGYWNPPGNSTTLPGVFGFRAPTPVGTATTRSVATTNVLTRMRRLSYVTTATTAGLLAQQYVAVAQFTTGDGAGKGGFTMIARFGQASVGTAMRFFCGMSSNVGAATNVEASTLTNTVGVAMISTDLTQWYIVYGGSAAQTAIALGTGLGAPNSTTTAYELALFATPASNGVIGYQVTNLGTGVIVSGTLTPGTPGTQTPLNTTLLAFRIWTTNNATGGTVGYDLCSCYIETDN